MLAILTAVRRYLIVGLVCISLLINDLEHLFMCSLAIALFICLFIISLIFILATPHSGRRLSFPTRDWTQAPVWKLRVLSHWTTRDVPPCLCLNIENQRNPWFTDFTLTLPTHTPSSTLKWASFFHLRHFIWILNNCFYSSLEDKYSIFKVAFVLVF